MKIRRRRRRNPWLSSGQEAAPALCKRKGPDESGPFKGARKKSPEPECGAFVKLSRRRPTFPHSYPCSIIGPARLNFRVRDGNGCDPRGMTTGNLRKRFALGDQISDNRYQEARAKLRFESFRKRLARRHRGAADNSLGWRYKFGPLPNNYCVLQDVADWSRN